MDSLNISAIVDSYSAEGGSMFDPRDMLALVLYSLLKGVTSSVRMAELINDSLPYIYLSGGLIIKRRTICDFRLRHIGGIRKIFQASIEAAEKAGLINDENLFALDGSKIEANASFAKTRQKGEGKIVRKKLSNMLIVFYVNERKEMKRKRHEKKRNVKNTRVLKIH